MVITSPFSSIRGYIVSKPPLVLFTLCLMGFAITTFSFAYYVEHNKSLPNLDARRDLISFLNHLGKRIICITSTDLSVTKTETIHNNSDVEDQTIYITANLDYSFILQNISHVEGYVSMSEWVSECLANSVEKVKISFAVPPAHNQTGINYDNEVCVKITGPKFILEYGSSDDHCKFSPNLASSTNWGHIIYKSSNDLSCSENKSVKLSYIPNSHNSVVLTQHDRSVINLHLFHTSYFLLVMAITLICYAMIKGKPISKHQSAEKVPLDV